MSEANMFLTREPEITKLLAEGWDICEGPFSLGNLIFVKLVKHENPSYTRFKADGIDESTEDEHQW